MEQEFTQEQEQFILETIACHEETLINLVTEAIAKTEVVANAEFARENITFTEHSPINADYLSIYLLGALFDRLHKGDLSLGEKILTMEAKRLGISLHID
ncbi:hypothetical protein ACV1WV_07985 [Serratia marcescens]|uniref:hypothetical protein n=1 Tax=Serratia nevei TaxID=2703794 RepID=UPI00313AD6FA